MLPAYSGELEDNVKEHDVRTGLQESIIDMDTVLCAVSKAKRCKPPGRRSPLDLLDGEPTLQEFLKGSMLEIAGNMAINGCSPSITRSVYREASFLLAVTFNAVRQAQRDLYADLLPQAEIEAVIVEPQADHILADKPDCEKEDRSNKESKS
jgi:hypothetical protein